MSDVSHNIIVNVELRAQIQQALAALQQLQATGRTGFGRTVGGLSEGGLEAGVARYGRTTRGGEGALYLAGRQQAVNDLAQARASKQILDAKVREAGLSRDNIAAAQAKYEASREEARILRARAAGYADDDIARMGPEAAAATAAFVTAQRRRGLVAANISDEEIAMVAQERAAMAATNNAIKMREKAILRDMIQRGELGGTFMQRRLAMWAPGTRVPADYALTRENIKTKAFTTLGYGVSALGMGLAFQGISSAVREATQLEGTFVRMRGQLTALGRVGDFDRVRNGIKGISTETGIAASDVAEFSSRMLGVFAERGTDFALKQTDAAMKLMVVTGIDLDTMMQSVIPTAKSFNVSVEDIGNTAVATGELLGISEEQVVEFLGRAATVAKQTGLNMQETTVLGATMAQSLGKPLSASADVLNKMPELIDRNQQKIFALMQQVPAMATMIPEMQGEIAQGQTGKAAITLLRAVAAAQAMGGLPGNIAKELPGYITNPREVEEGTALLTNAITVVNRLGEAEAQAGKSGGALESRFQKLQDTVGQTFERIQRTIESFAESLFDLGIGELFEDIGASIELALGGLGLFVQAISGLDSIVKGFGIEEGLISPLLRLGLQAAIITKILDVLNNLRKKMLGTSAETTTAEGSEAAARNVNAASATRETGAIEATEAARLRYNAASASQRTAMARQAGMTQAGGAFRDLETGAALSRTAALSRLAALNAPAASAEAAARAATATAAAQYTLPVGTPLMAPPALGARTAVTGRIGAWSTQVGAQQLGTAAAARFATESKRLILPVGTDMATRLAAGARNQLPPVGASMAARFVTAQQSLITRVGGLIPPVDMASVQANSARLAALRAAEQTATAAAIRQQVGTFFRQPGGRTGPGGWAYAFGQRGSALPAEGVPGYASWTSRAFSGGRLFRNVSAGANAAVTGAGMTPGIVGSGMLLPAIGITAASVAAVYSRWQEEKAEVNAAADNLREKVKTASRDKLQKIIDEGSSTIDQIGAWINQEDLPEEIAAAGIAYQEAQPAAGLLAGLDKAGAMQAFQKQLGESDVARQKLRDYLKPKGDLAKRLGLSGHVTGVVGTNRQGWELNLKPEEMGTFISKLRTMLESKNADEQKQAAELVEWLGTNIFDMPEFAGIKSQAEAGIRLSQLEQKVATGAGIGEEYESIKSRFEAGAISSGAFIGQAQQARDRARANADTLGGDLRKKADEDVAKMDKELRDMRQDALKSRLDTMVEIARLSGRQDPEQAALTARLQMLPRFDMNKQIEMLPETISQLEKAFAEEVDSIADPVERARRRLEGFQVPESVRRLYMVAQIRQTPELGTAMEQLAPLFQTNAEQMADWVAQRVLESNMSVIEVTNRMIQEKRNAVMDAMAQASNPQTLMDLFRSEEPGAARQFKDLETQNQQLLEEQAKNILTVGGGSFQQLVGGMAGFFNQDLLGMGEMIVEKSKEWDLSIAETVKRLLIERRDAAIAAGADSSVVGFLDQLIASATGFIGQQEVEQAPEKIYQNARETRRKDLEDIAASQKLDLQIAAAGIRNDPLRQAQAELDQAWVDYKTQLQLQAEGFDDPAARKQAWLGVLEATSKIEEARRDIVLAQLDWAEIYARGDPQAEIEAKINKANAVLANAIADAGGNTETVPVIQAQQELYRLQQEAVDASLNVLRSTYSILAAQAERDPVAAAQVAQAQAQFELENARGAADQNEKLAAKIRADRALENAISELYASRAELAIAIANAAGDPVKAAEIAANEARRKVEEARAQGAGETVINPLEAALVTANENLAKTARSRQEQIIDFQLQMGQITTQVAIEQLRLILSQTRAGTDEYMQLALKIRQLEQQAAQDLQFNLPTALGLPTLYEARRVTQGTAAGIGYQDNRTVSLVVQVNGAQDPMAVTNQVMAAFQSAMGTGVTYTPQVGVGV